MEHDIFTIFMSELDGIYCYKYKALGQDVTCGTILPIVSEECIQEFEKNGSVLKIEAVDLSYGVPKLLLQRLWNEKISWDKEVDIETKSEFQVFSTKEITPIINPNSDLNESSEKPSRKSEQRLANPVIKDFSKITRSERTVKIPDLLDL
ncbi:hypothetical protein NPIL_562381 [Nephila pilipes]|uniref:Uncharacterized protein n=1 Tax=Nephila pilipes TaxID=299642 RepID=A0A8X6TH03_NEPPI|nr:hypothetical protein NPIL_562381 [Nephila pilipes]